MSLNMASVESRQRDQTQDGEVQPFSFRQEIDSEKEKPIFSKVEIS